MSRLDLVSSADKGNSWRSLPFRGDLSLERVGAPILLAVSAAFLCLYFLFFLYRSMVLIRFEYTSDFMESYVLAQTRILAHLGNPYTEANVPPYLGAVYAPFYMMVLALVAPITGGTYLEGRILSLVSTLLIGALIYSIVKRETRSSKVSLVSALFFFASNLVYSWSPGYHPDLFGIMLAVAGIAIVQRYQTSSRIYLVIPLFALAFFTKQNLVAAPVAVIAFLLVRDWRLALRVGGGMLLAVLGLLAVAQYLTHGQYLLHVFTFLQSNPISVMHAIPFVYKLAIMHPILLAFVGCYLFRKERDRGHSLLVYWLVAAFFVALYGSSKEGAWVNYWIELFAGICILFGLSWHALQEQPAHRAGGLSSTFLAAAILMQVLIMFHAPRLPNEIQKQSFFYHFVEAPTESDRSENARLLDLARSAKGTVLSLDGEFWPSKDAGNIELGPEPFLYPYLREAKLWNPGPFVDRIRAKEFSLIISRYKAAEYKYEVDNYYEQTDRTENYFVYRPRS